MHVNYIWSSIMQDEPKSSRPAFIFGILSTKIGHLQWGAVGKISSRSKNDGKMLPM